jgi:hypothetical protein
VEADDLYHTAGNKGQAKQGGKKALGRRARGRRKKREPGRDHYDKDRPAIIAWVSRQGTVVIQATRDFTVKTVQKAADLAVQAGSRLYTDSANSYRALKGYVHEFVKHTLRVQAFHGVHDHYTPTRSTGSAAIAARNRGKTSWLTRVHSSTCGKPERMNSSIPRRQ